MKNLIFRLSVLLITVLALTITACSGTSKAQAGNADAMSKDSDTITTDQANLTLADYLRRVPGVRVQGTGSATAVMVRGASTVGGSASPLFVIDGAPIGNDYSQAASMVDVNDIDKIRVLKDAAETSSYGMQGSQGVILIKTKKN